jgi:NDP-sugar pyrophosphorylase family protein
MLPVGDQPLLEIILKQLRQAGIRQVKLSLHHQSEKIAKHFGDGAEFGVDLSYLTEEKPMGTVGGLGLLEPPKETTLVMNGDLLTQVDFRAMLAFHREHQADLTVAVRAQNLTLPYGVIECDGPTVRGLKEKPVLNVFVNAGIYLLEPSVYLYIPQGERFDMTDLIQRLLTEGRPVVSFPIREYWLDIGGPEGYAQALEDIKTWETAPEAPARQGKSV